MDFTSNFNKFSTSGQQAEKILEAVRNKVDASIQEKFFIKELEGKTFFFGNLFKILVESGEKSYEIIIYHDHTTG